MSRACLITLLAFAAISCAAASRILEDDAAAMGRELLQTKADRFICSNWCAPNQCIRVGTTGIVKCNKCKNNMKPILAGVNAGQCGCPAGTYFNSGLNNGDCVPCEVGSYCFKQLAWINNTASGSAIGKTACGSGLTTRARRSSSVWDCINQGGYFLTASGAAPTATACALNTYAIAKSKQAACTPCPPGMVVVDTPSADPRDKPTSCKVPAGYFMKSPGQIAPCDQGSYQPKFLAADQAAVGACTSCPEGVTTKDKGSELQSDCKKLKPGYVATSVTANGIEEAVLCPQGWYCPGDVSDNTDATPVTITALNFDVNGLLTDTNYVSTIAFGTGNSAATAKIAQCASKTWTKNVGATQVDQCMVPPGFEIKTGGADITLCDPGSYRANWVPLAKALATPASATCALCGDGIGSDMIEPITLYSLVLASNNTDYTVVNTVVAASSKSCFITQGQGMYYVASGLNSMVYKAKDCGAGATGFVPNSYGVADKVYGLAQTPCKLCPAGTIVDTSQPPSNTYMVTSPSNAGFFNPLACVTKPGYGWDGRVATLCAKGWYNPGNNYQACTQCGYGLTTNIPDNDATNHDNANDCLQAPGFGLYDGKMQQCPAGTYNSAIQAADVCATCHGYLSNSWTEEDGSDANTDCTVCAPGYGGSSTSACVDCGGDSAAGSYGPPGRDTTQCVACATSAVGFQFWFNNTAYPYIPAARAKSNAQNAADCVSAVAQIEDGLWFLGGAEGATATTETDVAACATACINDPECALVTFDYAATANCKVLQITDSGTIITAFKAVPSSDVSQSRKLQAAKPKAVSTGMYTQWQYAGTAITAATTNTITADTAATKAACFDACDAVDNCAGVIFDSGAGAGLKCKLFSGATDPSDNTNASKRSLTKAVPSKFAIA